MEKHAILSPSAASRWLHCTASARLEEHIPDPGSDFAAEGTAAHARAAVAIVAMLRGEEPPAELPNIASTPDMLDAVEVYVNYCRELLERERRHTPDTRVLVEYRVDLDEWAPASFGTADLVVVSDDTLHVADFKYGTGVRVDADHNPQLMLYALGIIGDEEDVTYSFTRVMLHIVQPRIGNIQTWETSVDELLRWGRDVVKPRAAEAYYNRGVQLTGDWCRFCKARPRCRAMAELARGVDPEADPRLLSAGELAAMLPSLRLVKAWATTAEDYAYTLAAGGTRLPGFKLVRGRAVRRVTNPDLLGARLVAQAGLGVDEVYRPRELRTITELERRVGRKTFAECAAGCVDRAEPKAALVADDDPRAAIDDTAAALGAVDISGL